MKYIDEYRDGEMAQRIAERIRAEVQPERQYRFMEFCGGHTHAISRYGVSDLLPANVRMIHGPGCPVCVLPIGRIDLAVKLALEHGAILCSYGDTLRVPASHGLSLLRAKAQGRHVTARHDEAGRAPLGAPPHRPVPAMHLQFTHGVSPDHRPLVSPGLELATALTTRTRRYL